MGLVLTDSPLKDGVGSTSAVCHGPESSKMSQRAPIAFIVDGDKAVCESLALLVACEGWRPEIFTSAEEFLRRPLKLVPSCLILDVFLPGLSGLELQKRVAAECPHVPIIFLSAKCDVPTTVQAMKAGAAEFFTKPFQDEELLSALREALERSHLAIAQEVENRALLKCHASLTLRERQVMALVSFGWLNREIGCELGISEITVKAHRGQVMRKMRATSLADLVKMATKLGLATSLKNHVLHHNLNGRGIAEHELLGSLSPSVDFIPIRADQTGINKRSIFNCAAR